MTYAVTVDVIAPPALRPYQEADVGRIRAAYAGGASRLCYQLPTGGGKTIVFAYILAAAAAKGARVLILAHRIEIIEQIAAALTSFGVRHGIVAAGHPETPAAAVQVASVFTLVRRLSTLSSCRRGRSLGGIGSFDLVIIDECHHAVASTWRDIIAALRDARILGVSATPERLDGKGLDDIFEELIAGPSVKDLIGQGFLAPFTAFGPKTGPDLGGIGITAGDYRIDQLAAVMSGSVIVRSAVSEYRRLCPGVPAITFCVDIDHSQAVTRAFLADGWRAAHLDGTTPRDERQAMIAALAAGDLDVLSNCGLISEGVDVPAVVAAVLLRPTMSRALYLQQAGRALRPGKPRALILDHAGCIARHGLPDTEYPWSLEGRAKEQGQRERARQCEACGAFNPPGRSHCCECGAAFPTATPTLPRLRGERVSVLDEIDAAAADWLTSISYGEALDWAGADKARLREVARARGYKPGWIYWRLKEAQNVA